MSSALGRDGNAPNSRQAVQPYAVDVMGGGGGAALPDLTTGEGAGDIVNDRGGGEPSSLS